MSSSEDTSKPAPAKPAGQKAPTPASAPAPPAAAPKPATTAAAAAAAPPKPAATTTTAAAAKPAAAPPAPKKEPEPPAFEKGLAQQVTSRFGDSVKILYIKPLRIKVMVADPSSVVEVATFLRDSMGFDHAESAGGTDYPKDKQIEVAYHLGSYTRDDLAAHVMVLAMRANRDDARLPSLVKVYPSVEYHERETFEMLGVYFEGHQRMERFLLPEDWADIPPLRKDFRIKGR